MEDKLIDVHLKSIEFKDPDEQKDLLIKSLIYSIGEIEDIFTALKYYRVFKNGEEYHTYYMHSEKWMMERETMSDEEIYTEVRDLLKQGDYPFRLVVGEVFPYLYYFHGMSIYSKLHHASPLIGIMENLICQDNFLYEDDYDLIWNNILDNEYYEEDEHNLAEMLQLWMTYKKNPLQSHMKNLYDRYLKMNGILQCEKSEWLPSAK